VLLRRTPLDLTTHAGARHGAAACGRSVRALPQVLLYLLLGLLLTGDLALLTELLVLSDSHDEEKS
jgi:hypothetical protein